MKYEKILEKIKTQKKSHQNMSMNVIQLHSFSVLKHNDFEVIVDHDIAKDVQNRMWCEDSGGYAVANINGTLIRLHDYVMAKTYGSKPVGCYVDHINQDKHDNRRINLRFVTPTENSMNVPKRTDNTSGIIGVTRTKHGSYRAYITINQKQINLGYYKTKEEAATARREAEIRLGFKTRPGTIKDKVSCFNILMEAEE